MTVKSENKLFFDSHETSGMPDGGPPLDFSAMTQEEILPAHSTILRLEIHGSDFTKTFTPAEAIRQEGVNYSLVSTSKRLIDKKYLVRIAQLDSGVKTFLRRIGLRPKPGFIGHGEVVPLSLLPYTVRHLEAYAVERAQLVENLLEKYDEAKAEVATANPTLYKESEYPDADTVRQKFGTVYNIFNVQLPGMLERLDEEIVSEAMDRADAQAAGVREETVRVLKEQREAGRRQLEASLHEIMMAQRAGLLELVTRLGDKVRGIGTERKVFKPGFVDEFRVFLETFSAKNLAGDKEMEALVNQARNILDGVSPDSIRNDIETRIVLERELGEIQAGLSLMVEEPKRRASFA